MSHTHLRRLISGLDPLEPKKEELKTILDEATDLLLLGQKDREKNEISFEISYEGHDLAPRRASGEIYFMHVFRQYIDAVEMMLMYGVISVNILCAILLHDTVEDAEKGKSTPFIAKSKIHLLVGVVIAYFVMCMTKKKQDGESRTQYLERILACDAWEVLVAKPFDLNDNTITLCAMPIEKQKEKVAEVLRYSPLLEERALHLIENAGKKNPKDKGYLKHPERWQSLVKSLHSKLRRNARKEQKRIQELEKSVA